MSIDTSARRLALLLVSVAAVFIIISGIQNAADILNPILLAMVITITLLPVPQWLIHRKVPPWLAIVLTILIVVGILVLVGWLVLASVTQIDDRIPELTQSLGLSGGVKPAPNTPQAYINDALSQLRLDRFLELFGNLLVNIGNSVAQIFLTLLIFVFMVGAALSMRGTTSLQGVNFDAPMFRSATVLTHDVRKYMILTTVINFLVGLGNTLLLWVLGVPYAVLWGILSWIMGYIPAVGFWIALIPPVILAYGQQGFRTAAIVFVGYVVINGTVENIVKPRIFGQGLRISPLVVFVSLFVWTWLLGGIGAILAIPLTLLVVSFLENFEATAWMAALARMSPGGKAAVPEQVAGPISNAWAQIKGGMRKAGLMSEAPAVDLPTPPEIPPKEGV